MAQDDKLTVAKLPLVLREKGKKAGSENGIEVVKERAMAAERPAAGPDWKLLHIQSAVPGARFATTKAMDYLEYSPVERG